MIVPWSPQVFEPPCHTRIRPAYCGAAVHEVTIETWLKKIGDKHIEDALRIPGMDAWSRAMSPPSSMTHQYSVVLVDLYMSVSASLSFSCVELQDGINAVHARRSIFPTDTADATIFENANELLPGWSTSSVASGICVSNNNCTP